MLRVFEAFSGIGTQRMALRNLGIEHEVVCIAEIDKFAIRSYEAIHGETLNLGDVSKIDPNDVPDHDLFTYSFPCQDISVAGKGKGFKPESGTRSSLLWECEKIIEAKKPKYLLMENVKALISKKFKPGFQKWLGLLEELGYTNYWQVLNAKDYGIPQNRERVFCVSILGTHEPYVFPETFELKIRLKDILEDEVDEKFYLSEEYTRRFAKSIKSDKFPFGNEYKVVGTTKAETERMGTNSRHWVYDTNDCVSTLDATMYKQPKQILETIVVGRTDKHQKGEIFSTDGLSRTLLSTDYKQPVQILEFPCIAASRGRNPQNPSDRTVGSPTEQRLEINQNGTSNTITTVQKDNYVIEPQYRIRKLTPKECWRLMGISDEDFEKAQEVNSNTQLYKQAGNAIVVDVLEGIFRKLFLSKSKEKGNKLEEQLEWLDDLLGGEWLNGSSY